MSSTKWNRVFVNDNIVNAVRHVRNYMEANESANRVKVGPRINHTVYPDGKVIIHTHEQS